LFEQRGSNNYLSGREFRKAARDLGKKKGWKEIDCTGKKFVCDKKYPKIDAPVEFQII